MKNSVIFDLDGTLLNTLDDLADSTNYSLKQCNFPTRTLEQIRSYVGNGIRLLIERAVPEHATKEQIDECFNIFKAHYSTHNMIKTAPYTGVIELLESLKREGFTLAIVSNKYQQGVTDLAKNVFNNIVEIAIGEREGYKAKPAPDLVNLAISLANINKENAVYVGDSDVDVLTAKNSNLDMIAVTWGFRDKEFLKDKGATIFIDKPEQLIPLLKAM